MKLPPRSFSPAAVREMMRFSWPGNVRQLENVVERSLALSGEHTVLDVEDLPEEIRCPARVRPPEIHLDGDGICLDSAVTDWASTGG
jgi:DNA-binding NtrC family response regulator